MNRQYKSKFELRKSSASTTNTTDSKSSKKCDYTMITLLSTEITADNGGSVKIMSWCVRDKGNKPLWSSNLILDMLRTKKN